MIVGGYGSGGFHDFNQHDPELKGIDHMPENGLSSTATFVPNSVVVKQGMKP